MALAPISGQALHFLSERIGASFGEMYDGTGVIFVLSLSINNAIYSLIEKWFSLISNRHMGILRPIER
jgi:hypothetical protein